MSRLSFQSLAGTTIDPALLEQDWKEAHSVDMVRLGQRCLYYPGMLKVRYIPYDRIQWAYLRAEENRMSMCCGRVFVDSWYLLLYVDGEQVAKIEFQKKETAKQVLTALKEANDEILVGYTEENKKRVGMMATART